MRRDYGTNSIYVLQIIHLFCSGRSRSSQASSFACVALQAYRDEQIHCALSEAYVRVEHLEEMVTKLKHDDMLVQLYFRWGQASMCAGSCYTPTKELVALLAPCIKAP